MSDERFVHAWLLSVDPAWRRQPTAERQGDLDAFCQAAVGTQGEVVQHAYSTLGLRAEGELLLWRMASDLESIQRSAAELLSAGVGRWMTPALSMIGLIRPSQYVKRPTPQEQTLFEGNRSRYLVVYPFVKSTEWYLTSADERKAAMAGHIRVGHRYPQVRQLLAYSFGLDDQEFIVAYETDDLVSFQDLVRDLRETESRRATVRDTPIVTGINRPLAEALQLIAGPV